MGKMPVWESVGNAALSKLRYVINLDWVHVEISQPNNPISNRKWYLSSYDIGFRNHRMMSVHVDMAKEEALKLVIERLQNALDSALWSLTGK